MADLWAEIFGRAEIEIFFKNVYFFSPSCVRRCVLVEREGISSFLFVSLSGLFPLILRLILFPI